MSHEKHQHVAGIVGADATIISGDGFTVTRDEQNPNCGGTYIITFDNKFAHPPAVVVTLYNDKKDLSVHAVITYAISTKEVKILTGDADQDYDGRKGKPEDSNFSFIAFGEV